MLWIIYLLTISSGMYIVYEDFRYRAVSWILFPILGLAGILFSMTANASREMVFIYFLINLIVIFIQLILVKLYVRYKNSGKASLSERIGKGDIFFIVSSSFFFSPFNFILFLIASLLFSLIIHLILIKGKWYTKKHTTVPLAGLQSLFLIFCMLLNATLRLDITNDLWILNNLHTL